MKASILSLLFALASAQEYKRPAACRSLANGVIQDCGSSSDAFQITKIVLTPPAPVAGQPLDVHLVGELTQEISKGSAASISATVNGDKFGPLELDICSLAKERKFRNQCPVKSKHFDVHHTLNIPAGAPKGVYLINAHGFTQDKVRLFNITIIHKSKGH